MFLAKVQDREVDFVLLTTNDFCQDIKLLRYEMSGRSGQAYDS